MEEDKLRSLELKKGHNYWQWTFALIATATLFAYGMECGWISPTTKILQSNESPTGFPISDNVLSWIASSMSMAAVFGVSLYSYIADTYGRKVGLMLIAILQTIAWTIRLSYSSTVTLLAARILSGIAAGGCFNIAPMYVKEISENDIRGILGTFPMLMQNIGILVMYLLGAYVDYTSVIISALALPLVTTILLIKAPESPEFLIKKGKIDEAKKTVALLKGLVEDDKIIQSIVEGMQNEEAYYKSLPSTTLVGILKDKTWRRGFILIIILFFFHASNGTFAMLTYASTILISTGMKFDISPEIQSLSFPTILIIGSLSLAAVVERYGRKPFLIGTFFVSALSMATIAMLMIMLEQGMPIPNWLPVVAMLVSVAMLGAGVAPLPYIMMTEMFNFQIRAKVVGTVVTFAWFMSFVLITTYTSLANLAKYSPFIYYSIINLAGALFTLILLPETRGKTEEEIQRSLRCNSKGDSVKN